MKNCTIYFIRHATPDWSRNDLSYYIPPGPPLTEKGEKEAIELGKFLQETGIQYLLVSPLDRCQQTARIASDIGEITWHTEDRVKEWQPDESYQDVRDRIHETLAGLNNSKERVCTVGIVMHGGPIAVGLEILGMDEKEISKNRIYDHKNPLPPAGVWRAKCDEDVNQWEFDLVFSPKGEIY